MKSHEYFPYEKDIPEEHRVAALEQTQYLIGGEIIQWKGSREKVFSPIAIAKVPKP